MPGLIRGVARTAVIAGAATAVSGRVQRRQAEKYADRDAAIDAERDAAYQQQVGAQAPAAGPAPAAGGEGDVIAGLQQLPGLHHQGILAAVASGAQTAP